ncbi:MULTISPECIES: DMT family transporter [Bacillus]|uniref:Transporter n=2 Tax=Bacillus TaxID=1386 RepID=A0A0M4FN71_9BACI|nr:MULTISPECIES: EamA family transporter [Bacillus]ALC83979.1 transporter [Bacillus gobiensis]MBP1082936.1 drug/metabolite transporter (DMT)-like permease [Bacillus capparidis]MED1098085.1 EamA family transporter [Bacillus capparidis]
MVYAAYLTICFIFGTTFLAIKIGVDEGFPPFLSAGIRFFVAGLILFLWMAWRKKASFSLLLKKEMMITGMCLTFGTFATIYWAEQYISSGIAAVLCATAPLMIVIIQTTVLKQKSSRLGFIGCVVGLLGVVLLTLPSLKGEMHVNWLIGCIVVLLGQVFYASGSVYMKHISHRMGDASPVTLNAAQMILGGLMLIGLSLVTEPVSFEAFSSVPAVSSVLYLIVVGSMIGHSLYYWLVIKTGPVFPSTWLYVAPFIALTLGVLLYNEFFSWTTVLGGLTIVAGVLMVNANHLLRLLRKSPVSKTTSYQ